MADRTVYGLTHSENGWRMVDQGSCVWVKVPGTNVSLQIREGQPAKILGAFVADWNAYIEPVRDADSACWTATNSVASSNHLSGTACDVCWNSHPFRVANAGFNAAQLATMREMLAFYEDTVFWGNDWNSPKDAMHVQMGYDTYGSENVGRVQDFINRKIRVDGFSTFRRGGTPAPTPPPANAAVDVLVEVMGGTVSKDRYAELAPAVADALNKSGCHSVNRIAMWCAQIGHESVGLKYMKEIGDAAYFSKYNNRSDLGNGPTDGPRYPGRGPIQITGRHNYRKLSEWAHSKGYVPTPTFFEDQPEKLELDQYAFLGAIWYWTVARPDINALSDARDVLTVTRRINGGTNGLQDRQNRYNRAQGMGDRLLALTTTTAPPPTQGDDQLSAEAERMIREMYAEYRKEKRGPSRAFLAIDGNPVESMLGMIYNTDGNLWDIKLTLGYLFDVALAVEVVEQVAATGTYAGTWAGDREWLKEFGQEYCQGLVSFKRALSSKLALSNQRSSSGTPFSAAAPSAPEIASAVVAALPAPKPVPNVDALLADNARLRDELARALQSVAAPPQTAAVAVQNGTATTTGQKVGGVVDAVQEFTEHALTMNPKQIAAMNSAVEVISQTGTTNRSDKK